MLQKLRDQTQGTGFRVITVLLIFALVVGLGAANFFASTSSDVAEVGGQGISEFDLSRHTERERRRVHQHSPSASESQRHWIGKSHYTSSVMIRRFSSKL